MNQRASHFSLGNSGVAYSSVYSKDYLKKEVGSGGVQKQGSNPFRSSSVQNAGEKTSFQTTNKSLMRNWGEKSQPSALDPSKLKELRGHHFQLGNYQPGELNTSHKMFYDRKHISDDANRNQEESKVKMRAHHHDFKEQGHTDFKSSYSRQFRAVGEESRQGQVKQELGNAIVLGSHDLPMVTTSQSNYVAKAQVPSNSAKSSALQQTSALVLGSDPNGSEPMQTLNQLYFDEKGISRNELPEATMKELRSTHFNLGSMKQSYNTESSLYQSFQSVLPDQKAPQVPQHEAGGWAEKGAKFTASTTNRRELPERAVQPFQKHGSSTRSGFQLGSGQNSYETESKKNYVQKANEGHKLYRGSQANSVEIGYDKSSYSTEQKVNFKVRDHREGKFQIDVKAKNTEDHFSIGGQGGETAVTTYQDEFRKDSQNTNPMFHKQKPDQKAN